MFRGLEEEVVRGLEEVVRGLEEVAVRGLGEVVRGGRRLGPIPVYWLPHPFDFSPLCVLNLSSRVVKRIVAGFEMSPQKLSNMMINENNNEENADIKWKKMK